MLNKNLFSIKNYNLNSLNYGHKLVKLFSYKISVKLYNIYNIETKNTIVMKRRSTIGDVHKFVKITRKRNKEKYDDEEEEGSSKGIKKNKIIEDLNTISAKKEENKNSGLFLIDKKKIKTYDINNYFSGLTQIRKIIYISIIIILLILFIEYCYFYKSQKDEYNGHISLIYFKIFFRLYNQLLTSCLSIACVPERIDDKNCRNFLSIFNYNYSKSNPNENFNFTEYIFFSI